MRVFHITGLMRNREAGLRAAAIAWLAVFCLAFAPGHPAESATDENIASIHKIEGDVQLRDGDDEEWIEAVDGDELFEGTQVKTGPGSQALLRWRMKHAVKVFELTRLTVDELNLERMSEKTSVNISSGKTFVRANKLMSDKSSFTVRTPTAIAGVRGTEFLVNVQKNNTTSFSMLSGSLGVSSEGADLVLGENQAVDIAAGMQGTPQPVAVAPEVKMEMESISAEVEAEMDDVGAGESGGGSSGDASDEGEDDDTGSEADGESESGDMEEAGIEETGDNVDSIVDDIVDNTVEDAVENVTDSGADLPPMPPDIPVTGEPDLPPLPPDSP